MARGTAERVHIADVAALGALIEGLQASQAIALGALRAGLPDKVEVTTEKKLINGVARPDIIARTGANIVYNGPAFALLDFDSKGMPADVAAELKRRSGFWGALLTVLPALSDVARVTRRSTSAGLSRSDTGEALPWSDGVHVYVAAKDGGDSERFLTALHERCWLAGFGWMLVSASGALLERSIVDRTVGGAERLVFEGGPILKSPLRQDKESRRPIGVDGGVLDTMEGAAKHDVVATFVKLAVDADVDAVELEELRQLAKKLSSVGLRVIDSTLKAAQQKHNAQQAKETRHRQQAARRDPRPMIAAPFSDAPFLPVMDVLNDVVGKVTAAVPPLRDIDGITTGVRKLPVPNMHAFTQSEANAERENDG